MTEGNAVELPDAYVAAVAATCDANRPDLLAKLIDGLSEILRSPKVADEEASTKLTV